MFRQLVSKILVFAIRMYQWFISPLFPKSCRHEPSCSTYTVQAVRLHGPMKGLWLGIKRILKCHPLGTWGYDPVPGEMTEQTK